MKLSAYLSPSRHGVYYFRWPLPALDHRKRQTVRISLQTKCPDRAGDLARYLASCGRLMRDNSTLAGLRQHEIRDKVQAYFGLRLQREDSDLAERVMLHFADRDVPVLPVHDSFIIAAQHRDELVRVMQGVFHDAYGQTPTVTVTPTFFKGRLEVARSLFTRDGAIFVTLDDTEVHYAKVMMDEVFGREKFVAHIAWQKRTSPDDRVILGNSHDNILVFAREQGTTKRSNGTFKTIFEESANRLPMTEKQRAEYKNPDKDPKGPWVHRDFTAQNQKKNGKWGR